MRIMGNFNGLKERLYSFFKINLRKNLFTLKLVIPLAWVFTIYYIYTHKTIPKSNLIINIIGSSIILLTGFASIESCKTDFERDFVYILNSIANYIWIIDLKKNKIKVYYRHADYFVDCQIGYVETLHDLLYLIHPNDRGVIHDLMNNKFKHIEEAFEIGMRIKGYGNSWRLFKIKGNITQAEFAYGFAYDTTNKDRSNNRILLNSEKKLNNLVQNMNSNYIIIELNDDGSFGKHLDANDNLLKIFNCTREDLLSKTPYEINIKPHIIKKLENIDTQNKNEIEHSFICSTGDVRHVLLNRYDICVNEKKAAIIISKDITNIKNMQLDIKNSEEIYRTFFEILPDAIFVTENGLITYVNPASVNMFKFNNKEDLINKKFMSFIHPEYHDKVYSLKKENDKKYIEALAINDCGQEINVEIAYSTFVDGSSKANNVVILRDITKYVQAQEKMSDIINKNTEFLKQIIRDFKLKEELFSNLSHDFKTPLNIILGVIQLLRKFNDDSNVKYNDQKVKRYLSVMSQNCFRLLRLINNLTDLVKSDTGYLNLNLENVDIVKLLEDIVMSVVEFVENKGVEIVFDTNIEEKIILIDIDKIERTILNLLSNAIKNCKKGDLIKVNLICNDSNIRIVVEDTGAGIPKDKLKCIFERFSHFDKSNGGSINGSGIGLTLVKSFVDLHNGKIHVESELNVGTKFYIDIPFNQADKEKNVNNSMVIKDSNMILERINHELSDIYLD